MEFTHVLCDDPNKDGVISAGQQCSLLPVKHLLNNTLQSIYTGATGSISVGRITSYLLIIYLFFLSVITMLIAGFLKYY